MANYLLWFRERETLTLTQAVLLLCRETPSAEREGERRTDEHRAAERFIRETCDIIEVPAPQTFSVITGQAHPKRMTEGVRTKDLIDALRAQNVLVWGREILDALETVPRKRTTRTPRPREVGAAHRRRLASLTRYIKSTSRSKLGRFTSRSQWHAALRTFEPKHWNIAADTFERFWRLQKLVKMENKKNE